MGGLSVFVIVPANPAPGKPWIAYGPSVGSLPNWTGTGEEKWMFDRYFGHIDTIIGQPANLCYSTGIPVCILVLKKCKKPDDVLFINAAEHFVKGKRQNQLTSEHIAKIINTYQSRKEEPRYARRVEMEEIEKNDFSLNISRYINTAVGEAEISLRDTHTAMIKIESATREAAKKHNKFLKELGLPLLPLG